MVKTERPCASSKIKSYRERGCRKEAKFRVIIGEGLFLDVCEKHVVAYRLLGRKIIELAEM